MCPDSCDPKQGSLRRIIFSPSDTSTGLVSRARDTTRDAGRHPPPRCIPEPRPRPSCLRPIQNGKNMARSAMFFPWRAGRHPPPPGPKARRAGGPAEAGALIAGSRPITITCKSHAANFQCIQGHDKYLGAHFAWGAHFCLGLLHRGPYRYFSLGFLVQSFFFGGAKSNCMV